jgi:hypothetical protein
MMELSFVRDLILVGDMFLPGSSAKPFASIVNDLPSRQHDRRVRRTWQREPSLFIFFSSDSGLHCPRRRDHPGAIISPDDEGNIHVNEPYVSGDSTARHLGCTSTVAVDTALEALRTKVNQYFMNSSCLAHDVWMNKSKRASDGLKRDGQHPRSLCQQRSNIFNR